MHRKHRIAPLAGMVGLEPTPLGSSGRTTHTGKIHTAEDAVPSRERRLRRELRKRGCSLKKNRTRNPASPGYGRYMIIDDDRNVAVMGHMPFPFSLDLDQVQGWLNRHELERD